MLSFCCRKHQPNWKGSSSHWDAANWKRSFKFMISHCWNKANWKRSFKFMISPCLNMANWKRSFKFMILILN